MIPPTLAAFRALMQRVAWALDGDWYDKKRDLEADRDELQALATATPEQLLGIVGEVEPAAFREGRFFVVTQREAS